MANYFKRYERYAFVLFLLLTVTSGVVAVWCLLKSMPTAAKWIGTTGLLSTITGVVQLEVSGLFERILTHYSDDEKYPYGPPSYITREIIENPDKPFAAWLRSTCYFNARTGFWLITFGTMIQVVAIWI